MTRIIFSLLLYHGLTTYAVNDINNFFLDTNDEEAKDTLDTEVNDEYQTDIKNYLQGPRRPDFPLNLDELKVGGLNSSVLGAKSGNPIWTQKNVLFSKFVFPSDFRLTLAPILVNKVNDMACLLEVFNVSENKSILDIYYDDVNGKTVLGVATAEQDHSETNKCVLDYNIGLGERIRLEVESLHILVADRRLVHVKLFQHEESRMIADCKITTFNSIPEESMIFVGSRKLVPADALITQFQIIPLDYELSQLPPMSMSKIETSLKLVPGRSISMTAMNAIQLPKFNGSKYKTPRCSASKYVDIKDFIEDSEMPKDLEHSELVEWWTPTKGPALGYVGLNESFDLKFLFRVINQGAGNIILINGENDEPLLWVDLLDKFNGIMVGVDHGNKITCKVEHNLNILDPYFVQIRLLSPYEKEWIDTYNSSSLNVRIFNKNMELVSSCNGSETLKMMPLENLPVFASKKSQVPANVQVASMALIPATASMSLTGLLHQVPRASYRKPAQLDRSTSKLGWLRIHSARYLGITEWSNTLFVRFYLYPLKIDKALRSILHVGNDLYHDRVNFVTRNGILTMYIVDSNNCVHSLHLTEKIEPNNLYHVAFSITPYKIEGKEERHVKYISVHLRMLKDKQWDLIDTSLREVKHWNTHRYTAAVYSSSPWSKPFRGYITQVRVSPFSPANGEVFHTEYLSIKDKRNYPYDNSDSIGLLNPDDRQDGENVIDGDLFNKKPSLKRVPAVSPLADLVVFNSYKMSFDRSKMGQV